MREVVNNEENIQTIVVTPVEDFDKKDLNNLSQVDLPPVL